MIQIIYIILGGNMEQLYKKSEDWFAVLFIIIYVVGMSIAENISKSIAIGKLSSLIFGVMLSAVIYLFIKRNDLFAYYGLCKPNINAKKFLYYLPLFLLVSMRLWFGVKMNYSVLETLIYILFMLFVGFLEEIIFRGFLFKAMCKDNVKAAMIVSSVTFGIGHIVNLFNGRGGELIPTICQIFYATSIGFLLVILFYLGKSLWPCILTHGVYNAIGVFENRMLATEYIIPITIVIMIITCAYSLFLIKKLPKPSSS